MLWLGAGGARVAASAGARAGELAVHCHLVGIAGRYFALVGAAYRSGEVSRAYPLMRGTAPLLLALVSSVVLGESLSASAAGGWSSSVSAC